MYIDSIDHYEVKIGSNIGSPRDSLRKNQKEVIRENEYYKKQCLVEKLNGCEIFIQVKELHGMDDVDNKEMKHNTANTKNYIIIDPVNSTDTKVLRDKLKQRDKTTRVYDTIYQ